jgi:histidine triad (HIT) family protein
MQADCTFCQIVSGELPADLVDEDERTVAFMDINPATLGHVLVVPRRHVADVMSAGVDLVQANSDGSVGNQTVFHLHVLPRYHDDQLGSWWSPQTADPAEITQAARRLVDRGRHDPETTFGLASTTS